MADTHLEYPLQDHGYIHHWLIAGPQAIPVPDLASFAGQGDELALNIARHYHRASFDLHEPPLEWGQFEIDGVKLEWRYARCREDHLLDLAATYSTCHHLRAWAYADLIMPAAQTVEFVLTVNGLADVWINREHVCFHESTRRSPDVSFAAALHEGRNEILVRFARTAIRACQYVMALQLDGVSTQDVTVQLPVQHTNIPRRYKLERIYPQVHLEHFVVTGGNDLYLTWDDELEETGHMDFWVRDADERIKVVGWLETRPGERTLVGHRQVILKEGVHELLLLPPAQAIERYGLRYSESLPFYVLDTAYSDRYYGDYQQRRREALRNASERKDSLYAEIAKLALSEQRVVDRQVIQRALARIDRRQDGSVVDLMGLLGMACRYADDWAFDERLGRSIRDCALGFRYWHDEPGRDVICYRSESRRILFHACEVLAGQLWPDQTFANAASTASGLTGDQHRAKGERLALEWLRVRGRQGFAEWDAHDGFEDALLALAHLADLAENDDIRELSAIMIDKIMFTIAVNSYRGVFGSTHGRTATSMLKSGQLEATAGITRLMWGMGVWNRHIGGLVALACSNYELPTMIASIAVDLEQEMWHQERHPGVNKVTYRTPDYMLCSAQDYRPGEPGDRQHIWQATLGADAVVFVNHPACMSEDDAQRPNFWRGNAVLPRVAQWKDVLVAIHKASQNGAQRVAPGLDFTHAYFPVHEFDEYLLAGGWAFARKGRGYLALTSSAGFELVRRGASAFRELRVRGSTQVWVCMMGREGVDGTFEQFRAKTQALRLDYDGSGVRLETLRGQTISFGWQGDLVVDGEARPLSGFKHYDGPHCVVAWPASQMDICYGDYAVRLCFDSSIKT